MSQALPPNDLTRLPCGCVIGTQDEKFFHRACALGEDCEYVQYSIAETERQGKEVVNIDLSVSRQIEGDYRCPFCNHKLDGVTGPDHHPSDGDRALCMECTEVGIYENNGIRKPNKKESRQNANDRQIIEMRKMIRATKAGGN